MTQFPKGPTSTHKLGCPLVKKLLLRKLDFGFHMVFCDSGDQCSCQNLYIIIFRNNDEDFSVNMTETWTDIFLRLSEFESTESPE